MYPAIGFKSAGMIPLRKIEGSNRAEHLSRTGCSAFARMKKV